MTSILEVVVRVGEQEAIIYDHNSECNVLKPTWKRTTSIFRHAGCSHERSVDPFQKESRWKWQQRRGMYILLEDLQDS